MKEAIAILTGGGPAPGMNTVVGSVAKTFLAKGYRVIGLHYGYSGLFNPSPRYEDLTFTQADYIFNQGGSYLTMSRFKPTDKDFEENFNLNFFTENNVKLLVTVGGDDTASTANRIATFYQALAAGETQREGDVLKVKNTKSGKTMQLTFYEGQGRKMVRFSAAPSAEN